MARNTVDTCMICDEVNCKCGKPAEKKAVPKRATPARPAQVVPDKPKHSPPVRVAPTRTGARKAGPSASGNSPVQPGATRPSLARVKSAAEIEREQLGRAITCFAAEDMLHRDELVKHRAIIDLPPHRIDAMIWKQDNEAESERRNAR